MTALNYPPSLFEILLMDKCQHSSGAAAQTFLSLTQLQSAIGLQDERAFLPGDTSGFWHACHHISPPPPPPCPVLLGPSENSVPPQKMDSFFASSHLCPKPDSHKEQSWRGPWMNRIVRLSYISVGTWHLISFPWCHHHVGRGPFWPPRYCLRLSLWHWIFTASPVPRRSPRLGDWTVQGQAALTFESGHETQNRGHAFYCVSCVLLCDLTVFPSVRSWHEISCKLISCLPLMGTSIIPSVQGMTMFSPPLWPRKTPALKWESSRN